MELVRPLSAGNEHQVDADLAAQVLDIRDLPGIVGEKPKADREAVPQARAR